MPTYYTNGSHYCRKRNCRKLHRGRGRVRPTDATDDLQPCPRHVDTGDTTDTERERNPEDIQTLIENGICPWCDDYEGDHVGRHASSAHADKWADYKEKL